MTKINITKFFFFFVIVSFFQSCERGYMYNYIVENNTDTAITIFIKTASGDSIISFKPKEIKSIYSTFHGMEGSGGPFQSDIRLDLDSIVIKKGENLSKDYRENKYWKFIKVNESKADYRLNISDTSF